MLNPYLLSYKDKQILEEYQNQRKEKQRKLNQFIGWSFIGFQIIIWLNMLIDSNIITIDILLSILTGVIIFLTLFGLYQNRINSMKAIKYFFTSNLFFYLQFQCPQFQDFFLQISKFSLLLQGWAFGFIFVVQLLVLPNWYQKLIVTCFAMGSLGSSISILSEFTVKVQFIIEVIFISLLVVCLFYIYEKYEKENFQKLYEQKRSLQEWKNLLNYTMASSIFVIVPELPTSYKLRFYNQTFTEKFGHISNNEFLKSIQRILIKEHKSTGQSKRGTIQQNQNENNTNNLQAKVEEETRNPSTGTNNVINQKQNINSERNQRHYHHYSSSSSSASSSSTISPEQNSSNLLKKIDQIYQQLKQNRTNEGTNINTTKSFSPQIEEKYHNCLFKHAVVLNNEKNQQLSEHNNKYSGQRVKVKSEIETSNGVRVGALSMANEQLSPRKKTSHSIDKSNENSNSNSIVVNVNQYFDIKLIGCYWDEQDAVMVIMDDISEKIINERLKETDEYKDQMLATVTHDLKTPLNGIIIMIKTLIETNQHSQEELKVMRMVLQNANLLLSMIQDILDYSQIKRNVLRLAPDKFRIEEVLEEVYELFSIQAQEKGLELRVIKDGILCNHQNIQISPIPSPAVCGSPANQNSNCASSSGKFLNSFHRADRPKKKTKLSNFFNGDDQTQSLCINDNLIQNTKRRLAEIASSGQISQLQTEQHNNLVIQNLSYLHHKTHERNSSLMAFKKSLSLKSDEFQLIQWQFLKYQFEGSPNEKSNKKQDDNNKQKWEDDERNISIDFIQQTHEKKNKYMSKDKIDIEQRSMIDEDEIQSYREEGQCLDDNRGEDNSHAVIDQRRFNGKRANQSSNLLKFSIDLMSQGKFCTEVYSDKRRIKQILINLVGNALKFTERGSISIEYNLINDKNMLELVVRDTGVGISESLQPKLFKVYSTFDHNNGSNRHGVGLGLAICKKLAEQLGPQKNIKLSSTKGEGSAFSFLIYQDIGLAIKKYRQKQYQEEEEEEESEDNEDEEEILEDDEEDTSRKDSENAKNQNESKDSNKIYQKTCNCKQNIFNDSKQKCNLCQQSTNKHGFSQKQFLDEQPSSYQTPYCSFSKNEKTKYNDNISTLRIDETDQLNSPSTHALHTNRKTVSQLDKSSNYSPILNQREIRSVFPQEDQISNYKLDESCNYEQNLIDEVEQNQHRQITKFNHKLGKLANKNVENNTNSDVNPISIQQKLLSQLKLNVGSQNLNKLSQQHSSISLTQNETNQQQQTQNLLQSNYHFYMPKKHSTHSNDQNAIYNSFKLANASVEYTNSPTCSIVQNQQISKYLSDATKNNNKTQQNVGSGIRIVRTNSQSVRTNIEASCKGTSTSQKVSQQLSNKVHSPQINNTVQQSYIYEFKRLVNILIVDDTAFNLIALKAMLKKVRNINLIVDAYNGKDAFEKFKSNNFDLVLMDINMPIMDGQESMKHIRSYEKEIYQKSQRKNNNKHQSLNSPLHRPVLQIKKEIATSQANSVFVGDASDKQMCELSEELTEKSPTDPQNLLLLSKIEDNDKQNSPLQQHQECVSEKYYQVNQKNEPQKKRISNFTESSPKQELTQRSRIQGEQEDKSASGTRGTNAQSISTKPKSLVRMSRRIKTENLEENQKIQSESHCLQISQFQTSQLVSKSNFSLLATNIASKSNINQNCKNHWKAIIFAVTAYDQQQEIQKYLQAGANAHISKPIKLENLFSVINKFF